MNDTLGKASGKIGERSNEVIQSCKFYGPWKVSSKAHNSIQSNPVGFQSSPEIGRIVLDP